MSDKRRPINIDGEGCGCTLLLILFLLAIFSNEVISIIHALQGK